MLTVTFIDGPMRGEKKTFKEPIPGIKVPVIPQMNTFQVTEAPNPPDFALEPTIYEYEFFPYRKTYEKDGSERDIYCFGATSPDVALLHVRAINLRRQADWLDAINRDTDPYLRDKLLGR